MATLSVTTKTTHHVDWLTYSYNREKGECGIQELAEEVYGVSIDMGGAAWTEYSQTVAPTEMDSDDLAAIIKNKYIEDYQLGKLMDDMCFRGNLPASSYVVTISW